MISLSELQYSFQRVCTPLAFISNCVLIHLILYKSPKSLGIYKYLMIYISLFEIFYSILDAISTPDCYGQDTVFLVVVQHPRVFLPFWMHKPLNTVFCSMFGLSLGMFGLHFIYRYMVITGNPFLKTTTLKKLSIWFLSPVLYGIAWGCILELALGENEHVNQILMFGGKYDSSRISVYRKHYLPQRGLRVEDVTYYCASYWDKDKNGNEIINMKVMFAMFLIMSIVSSSIFTIVYFATMSYRKMSVLVETSSNSKQYRTLQLQLLNSLVAQALIPTFLMQGPACIIFTTPLFHMGNAPLGSLLGFFISLYPVLDPFPTMFIVSHYRKALLNFFRRKPKVQRNVAIAATNSSKVQ